MTRDALLLLTSHVVLCLDSLVFAVQHHSGAASFEYSGI
jgi:hypothetical protein